jgi:hypothetical protein
LTNHNRNARTIRVAIAILSYLNDNPTAKDTAQGIAKWWVSERIEDVERALQLLSAEGVIKKQKNIYHLSTIGLTKEKIASIHTSFQSKSKLDS